MASSKRNRRIGVLKLLEARIEGGGWRRGYNGFRQKELTHWSLKLLEVRITGGG
jgi:hypothetical protein